MLNLAIIGMGYMAGRHFENIIELKKGITIIGGYDIREESQVKAAKWGIKNYASPEDIYNDKTIDIVLIATPNDTHKEYSINSLKSGKHVICEKPAAMNAAELEEILATAKETQKCFFVHQNRRWDTDYLTIRKILATGLLRNPYSIESRVQGSRPLYGWRAFKQNGGGLLLDWGVHILDQILDLIPQKIVSVSGHLHHLNNKEVDNAFTAFLRFEDGCSVIVNITTNCFDPLPRWHLSCQDGTAVIEDWEVNGRIVKQTESTDISSFNDEHKFIENIVYTAAGPTRTMLPRPKETTQVLPLPKTSENSWDFFYQNVLDVIEDKAKPFITGHQATRVMKVIDAIFESDSSNTTIAVKI